MAHFAIVCPPTPGHFNPLAVLGRVLLHRGHTVTVFQIPALADTARAEGLDFQPVGDADTQALAEAVRSMAERSGLAAVRFAIQCSRRVSDLLCRELPDALRGSAVDLVLADQNEPAAATVAERLNLPFVSVCPGLPLNREPAIPPPFFGWRYRDTPIGRTRNRAGIFVADRLIAPINRTLNRHRREWGLQPIRTPDDTFSRAAQICQLTEDFDFPRRQVPAGFHYVGPLIDGYGRRFPFPYEKLNGKPLVYVTLGTLQNPASDYFRLIARVCAKLDVQIVIAAGTNQPRTLRALAGSPIVVQYAPQLEILARASLTITHSGLNTVMQSLLFGVPMVAIPLTHDQPAIAARIAHSGTGEVIPPGKLDAEHLTASIRHVLENPRFHQKAARIRESIRSAGGAERGADVVERVLARSGR
ncbi:MAG TPA: glycosyltransferase [Bryobacteraceae bacterium]|nr:glycosyltransferase [Bryobacteraceae bacterium]